MQMLNEEYQNEERFRRAQRLEQELSIRLGQELFDPTKFSISTGEDAVLDDIFSYQVYNKMKNHWAAATAPADFTEGMIRYDTDVDRPYFLDGAADEVELWSKSSKIALQNLLSNSGVGCWSQSDTNKGLGVMTFDSGSVEPTVGETMTGATSGAVGKVIKVTLGGGTYGGGNAYGDIELGACTGRFQDNEDITGSVGGANMLTVNMPDSAAGVDKVRNGDFSVDTDPPPGWTAVTATLTTEAGGQITNCMQVASSGAALGKAYQDITTVIGKIYKLALYFKKGTSDSGKFMIGTTADEDSIYDSGALTNAAWTAKSYTFEATATTTRITMQTTDPTITENSLFDEISLYEITPCCTGADVFAMGAWIKDSTLDIYRQHNDGGTLTKDGSFYALKLVPSTAADYVRWSDGAKGALAEFYQLYAGRTVTFGAWIKTSTASHAKLNIADSAANTSSSYHTGGGAWEWLEVTHVVNASPTTLYFYIYADVVGAINGDTIVYVSQPMLVFGSAIGEGNYQPKSQEVIWLEKRVSSNKFTGTTGWTDSSGGLNIEADSDGMLPKGCKALQIFTYINDSGSAGNQCFFQLFGISAAFGNYFNHLWGIANDASHGLVGWIPCDPSGDVDWEVNSSGANTFDMGDFRYYAIQVN